MNAQSGTGAATMAQQSLKKSAECCMSTRQERDAEKQGRKNGAERLSPARHIFATEFFIALHGSADSVCICMMRDTRRSSPFWSTTGPATNFGDSGTLAKLATGLLDAFGGRSRHDPGGEVIWLREEMMCGDDQAA